MRLPISPLTASACLARLRAKMMALGCKAKSVPLFMIVTSPITPSSLQCAGLPTALGPFLTSRLCNPAIQIFFCRFSLYVGSGTSSAAQRSPFRWQPPRGHAAVSSIKPAQQLRPTALAVVAAPAGVLALEPGFFFFETCVPTVLAVAAFLHSNHVTRSPPAAGVKTWSAPLRIPAARAGART
ncbi:hypothetical protein DFH08DRAFT_1082267 [Mycena albidolilacea]|uniref:Uncharacterized protein n=1 Tax=Mycena albidolilacea TaxID=1033008 RepID=A0AAD6ZUW8_9AGAR|nr:hypothetical protein DFH08DRAFT_1082267 [Mycena albidolilacea]